MSLSLQPLLGELFDKGQGSEQVIRQLTNLWASRWESDSASDKALGKWLGESLLGDLLCKEVAW
jgi:hypothetical protein